MHAVSRLPAPKNEPILSYAPGTSERATLKAALAELGGARTQIPLWVDGKAVETGRIDEVRCPHRHAQILADCHQASAAEVDRAIAGALGAAPAWAEMPFDARAAIFLRAADLLAGPWRARINAATMLGQSKTCHQAEIDSACELVDFLRWNVAFARRILEDQPESGPGTWNRADYRALEGFVFAVTPFNFTAIGGNLPTAPALMGNVILWKPAHTAALSNHLVMELLVAAGLPPGVIQLVPGPPAEVADRALAHPSLAGVHFTGSTGVFQQIWRTVGERIARYRTYPRLVGETGGKDFILAHPSADVDALATAIVRGGFEYQGQKCSAASRVYVPRSLWPAVRERAVAMIGEIRVGDVADFTSFMGAVIDQRAFDRIATYQALARKDGRVLAGGGGSAAEGYFIEPTLVELDDPKHRLMAEEIFGPVVSVFAYADASWAETLALVDQTSPYALTGAIFARDRGVLEEGQRALRNAAGNLYLNDKPTGAVVGQQPFGGARGSGTNDKAGSLWNLVRWTSPRTIKETFDAPHHFGYPFLREP